MKKIFLFILFNLIATVFVNAQEVTNNIEKQEIQILIDKYVEARENIDSELLESILSSDIDQLVSSGTWRYGKEESMKGMLQSSLNNPGSRKVIVEKIRFVSPESAIVDARYEIYNTNGSVRKMWSTFIVANYEGIWKISAIRNMLPTQQ